MDVVILIGRILFVLLFLSAAVGHVTQLHARAGYAKAKGIPAPEAATVASGVLMALGSLSILLGIWPDLGALLLVIFLLPTAFTMHAFWRETDEQARGMEQIQFLKDISLAGAAIMLFGLLARFGDEVGLTITGALFG